MVTASTPRPILSRFHFTSIILNKMTPGMKANKYGARVENLPRLSHGIRLNSRKNSPKLAAPTNSPNQILSFIFILRLFSVFIYDYDY